METTVKDGIIAAAKSYMAEYDMSASNFAGRADVGKSYLSNALNGKYIYQNTTIPDSFFRKIAATVGYKLEASYWEHVDTDQYVQIMDTLNEARERVEARMIVGETGSGKTYAVDRFCAQNPVGVYRVTVNDYDTVYDIMTVMYELLRIEAPVKRGARLRGVGRELRKRAMEGERPIVIIDEAENTKIPGIKTYKALYDMFAGQVAFVLVCTEELPRRLAKMKNRVEGMPQFIRRFKANTVKLVPVARKYEAFLSKVEDMKLRELLSQIADNYGELHDYLERALREADESGEPLTEALFRETYNLPAKR